VLRPVGHFFCLTLALLLMSTGAAGASGPLGGVNLYGGGPSVDQFQLDSPGAIVRVPDGPSHSFYVVDSGNDRILKLDASGKGLPRI
jgi:hypothetical protein